MSRILRVAARPNPDTDSTLLDQKLDRIAIAARPKPDTGSTRFFVHPPLGTPPEVVFDDMITIGGEQVRVPPAPARPKRASVEEIQAAVRQVLMERRARDPNY